MNPNANKFSPDGRVFQPYGLLFKGALNAAGGGGGTVEFYQGDTVYESGTISTPVTLTRDPNAEGPVTIGAAPISETDFRCIAYNVRMAEGAFGIADWGEAFRAPEIRDSYNDWGQPDFIGFCEVWAEEWWFSHLQFFGGFSLWSKMPYSMTGFAHIGNGLHSGLAAKSAYPLKNPAAGAPPSEDEADHDTDTGNWYRGEFGEEEGIDRHAAKGWLRSRVQKDGFGIWLIVTHLQADDFEDTPISFPTVAGVYSARRTQLQELRNDVNYLRDQFPSDVVILMGDFNVFGEDWEPCYIDNDEDYREHFDEYSKTMDPTLGQGIDGGMDVAKQFHPARTQFTYTRANSVVANEAFGDDEPEICDVARLDYIIAVGSKDGKVKVQPTNYEVIRGKPDAPITDEGITANDLSDHYGVAADLRIMRVAN